MKRLVPAFLLLFVSMSVFFNCGKSNTSVLSRKLASNGNGPEFPIFPETPTPSSTSTPTPKPSPTAKPSSPTPTPTPRPATPTPVPTPICDNSVNTTNWPIFHSWGQSSTSTLSPPVTACTANSVSRILEEKILATGDGTDTYVSAITHKLPHPGVTKRTADYSFMIPAGSLPNYNHVGAMAAFDPVSFSRIGAAVFRNELAVQFTDPICNGNGSAQHLSQNVPIPGELQPDHWYRIHTLINGTPGQLEVKLWLYDLDPYKSLAYTTLKTSCVPSWYNSPNLNFIIGFTATSPVGTPLSTNQAKGYVDDFVFGAY